MRSQPSKSLSIVVPCFNEAEGLATALDAYCEAASRAEALSEISSWEVVAVDDGSTDATREVLCAAAGRDPRIRLVTHESNRGLGAAIRSGFAAARGDVVLYTDADMPCDVFEDLPRALRLERMHGADIVAAYRRNRGGEGPRRQLYSAAYNRLARAGFSLDYRDVNFAFKLVRRRVLDALELHSDGSFVDVELLARADRAGFKVLQFGTEYFPRSRGVSTASSYRTIATVLREMVIVGRNISETTLAKNAGEPRVLVVNADDYGLTDGISEGILRAHEAGIVTSTSVLALGRGFRTSVQRLSSVELGVGVHLAAVGEDPPLLGAREIPTLVDRRGRLASSWRTFLAWVAAGRVDKDDLAREFAAQIDAVSAFAKPLSHVDTHQHLHLWPLVQEVVIDLALKRGINAIRVPRSGGGLMRVPINALADRLASRARAAGLVHAGWAAGLDQAGHLHGARLVETIAALGARGCDVELGCHPGHPHDAGAYRWSYDWDAELAALTSEEARRCVDAAGLTLGSYRDLAARHW